MSLSQAATEFLTGRPAGVSAVSRSAGLLASWVENGFNCTVRRDSAGLPYELVAERAGRGLRLTQSFTYSGGVLIGMTGDTIPTVFREEVMGGQALVSGGGDLSIVRQAYKAGVYGDSRVNSGWIPQSGTASATNYQVTADKPTPYWTAFAGNLRLAFMGGVSGDAVALWRTVPRGTNRSFTDAIAAGLEIIYVQYCINDIIGWNGTSPVYATHLNTVFENWKAFIAEFLKAGIKVVAESTQPCNDTSVSNYTGWTSTGGYGASAAQKAQMVAELCDMQRAWVASLDQTQIRFVDTHNALLDPARLLGTTSAGRPYGYADMTKYGDGTHCTEATFAWIAKQVADASNLLIAPCRADVLLPTFAGPNFVNALALSPTSGIASGVTTSQDAGTWSLTPSTGIDERGAYQEYLATATALASGIATLCINMQAPVAGASPSYSVASTDTIGAQVALYVDDGSGGAPPIIRLATRQRYFITAGGSVFSDGGGVSTSTLSNRFDQIFSAPLQMRCELPPVITGQASAALSAGSSGSSATGLTVFLYTTVTASPIRVRVYWPAIKRIA